jgi:hypothetical protein
VLAPPTLAQVVEAVAQRSGKTSEPNWWETERDSSF